MRRVALILALLALGPAASASEPDPDESQALERSVLAAVNEHRSARGLAPLAPLPAITKLARAHSGAMARGRVGFGHTGFRERVKALEPKIRASSAAENISRHTRGRDEVPAAALRGWLKSPRHRKNLQGSFEFTGIGAARSADGTWYLTQIFVAR